MAAAEGATDGYCFVFGQEPVGGDDAIASDLHLGRRTSAEVANPVDMGAPPRADDELPGQRVVGEDHRHRLVALARPAPDVLEHEERAAQHPAPSATVEPEREPEHPDRESARDPPEPEQAPLVVMGEMRRRWRRHGYCPRAGNSRRRLEDRSHNLRRTTRRPARRSVRGNVSSIGGETPRNTATDVMVITPLWSSSAAGEGWHACRRLSSCSDRDPRVPSGCSSVQRGPARPVGAARSRQRPGDDPSWSSTCRRYELRPDPAPSMAPRAEAPRHGRPHRRR